LSAPRAVVLVTGSELVRGDREDRNGPFLARELLNHGIEPALISIVGDRPDELEQALRQALDADLVVVTGGLGPTHDDRTVEVLARVAGVPLVVDRSLEAEIGAISRALAERLGRPYSDFEHGVRKQASLPRGAIPVGIAGTAPAIVLESDSSVAVVLPGPPAELRRLWPAALASNPVRRVLARARPRAHRVLRFIGASESTIAAAVAEAGDELARTVDAVAERLARGEPAYHQLPRGAVRRALDALRDAATAYAGDGPGAADTPLMPRIVDAVRARATVGEISDALEAQWGRYRPNT
jgi:nicotinamide-nucleotide amidase